MSVLQNRQDLHQQAAVELGVSLNAGDAHRFVSRVMWIWYEENENLTLFSLRKWFFSLNVRVRDVRPLFVVLFGNPD